MFDSLAGAILRSSGASFGTLGILEMLAYSFCYF